MTFECEPVGAVARDIFCGRSNPQRAPHRSPVHLESNVFHMHGIPSIRDPQRAWKHHRG